MTVSERIVNAIGDQCPVPVIKAMKALKEIREPGVLEIQVDNDVAVRNLTRLANSRKLAVSSEKKAEKLYLVRMRIEEQDLEALQAEPEKEAQNSGEEMVSCMPEYRSNTVVAIGSDCMGNGDDQLGRTLMKGFLYAVSQLEQLPKTILLYNGGVKLAVEGAVSVEDLKSMEAQGVQVLACGTCLNYYGLTEQLAVGSVTNMYAIVEELNAAGKVIRP
ncbi:MAG: sulfurtransferase-like selenium metabolism protein YedF [Clostridium sp.]|nr:sulfurtransferase-like selenium metabolism protein YedF [Clostridium sp.]